MDAGFILVAGSETSASLLLDGWLMDEIFPRNLYGKKKASKTGSCWILVH